MKNRLSLLLMLISMIVMVIGTAIAPHAPRTIHFLEARFVEGKGAVFLFEITGKFTQQEMKEAFALGNGVDPLSVHCVIQNEKSRIACTVKDVNRYNSVVVNIIGLGFWADVPKKEPCLGIAIRAFNDEVDLIGFFSNDFFDQEGISAEEFLKFIEEEASGADIKVNVSVINWCVIEPNRDWIVED